MTDHYLIADPAAWKQALDAYTAARAAWATHVSREKPAETDAVYERYLVSEDRLMTEPAPDFDAVIRKLEIIWEDELGLDTPDSTPMRAVIGDMRRLVAQNDR